jgi:choline dehydrogenase-like flavoprotein
VRAASPAGLRNPAGHLYREETIEFDYVIVGGGSAGCVLASRLSEDPRITVCLVEAGGEGRGILVRAPAGIAVMLSGRPRINNWAFVTEPQPGLDGRRGYQPRGKGLGGSSAINAMLYVRGHPADYDEWAALGATGWLWRDVLPYFRRAERNQWGADDWHGADGPLQVGDQQSPRPVTRAFIEACAELQIPLNRDFNGPQQEGAGLFQVTQFWEGPRRGERCSAAAAYLHPHIGMRANLEVITKAHATAVLFDGRRATGIRLRRGGAESEIRARREVILSAGAFGSPHLLLLSGVGPAVELARHGVPVRHVLPGVGRNLQDHLDFISGWTSPSRDMFGLGLSASLNLLRHILAWRRDGSGMIASPLAEAGAFIRSHPDVDRPDLQLHFVIGVVENHGRRLRLGYGYSCHVCVLRPYSRGEVGLRDPNPLSPPRIDPHFLEDERDAALLLAGVKKMRQILNAPALAPYRGRELHLEKAASDAELMAHIRARADTIYHPVGTCRMGDDEEAVVDPQLKVRGLEGLRVVDASVMPRLIGGNTNAPTIMIAEKAADLIKAG